MAGVVGFGLVLTGCGLAPQPPQAPLASMSWQSKRVMFVGDSLMTQALPDIISELDGHRMPATIINRAVGGWGLLTALGAPGTATKPADVIGQWVAVDQPDIVVVEFSGNYWPGQDGADNYQSLEWAQRWDAEAERFTQAVLAAHKKLYWVIPPPRSSIEPNWFGFRDLSIVEAFAHPGVGLVDWWTAATTYDGHWAIWVDDGDGQGMVPIRQLDGLHFTPQGTHRMAEWTVIAIRPEWTAPPPPTTTTTTTTTP